MRIASLLFIVIGVTMGCDKQGSCILVGSNGEFGTNHFEKIDLVSDHAKEAGLPTTSLQAAAIVGAAYAASQVAGGQSGVPVQICLRSGEGDHTEYRVLSTSGKPLLEWQSTAALRPPSKKAP